MKELDMRDLRAELEDMPTWQLDERLQQELKKKPADGAVVRLILGVLRERDEDRSIESNDEIQAAWKLYQEWSRDPPAKATRKTGRLLKVAAAAVIIGVLFSVFPQTAEAELIFDRLVRWSDSVFELLTSQDSNRTTDEYKFTTDHPGLQEVYDAVVELGVTEPVVPMWIPETLELTRCEVKFTPAKSRVVSEFKDQHNVFLFTLDLYSKNESKRYYKDKLEPEILEIDGTIHNIIQNNEKWVVIWTQDNIECSIVIECQEETLYKILKSIYAMEDE